MVCEGLSKYYPIVLKFLGYLLLHEHNTNAIDFGPNGSIPLTVHGSRVGHNQFDCVSVCK